MADCHDLDGRDAPLAINFWIFYKKLKQLGTLLKFPFYMLRNLLKYNSADGLLSKLW